MSQSGARQRMFEESDRPDVALITNHGYAGVEIPIGGAPDTGGQIVYVNTLARTLAESGYRVTIFARGGFPYFESETLRDEPEYLGDYARYIFVPGGGDRFIRKEDIAAVLDEEVDWLDAFVCKEASARGCPSWAVYEFVNTHYWDAGVIGMRLVERWRNDVAASMATDLLTGAISPEQLDRVLADRHRMALGEAPAYHLGAILLDSVVCGTGVPPVAQNCGADVSPVVRSLPQRIREAASRWVKAAWQARDADAETIASAVEDALSKATDRTAPAVHPAIAAEAMGQAILARCSWRAEQLERELRDADRHVWTPHSLGELKDENFRDRPADVRRDLKFCERRNHERVICHRTRAFAATSAEIAERLRTHYRVSADRVFYFPPCVDGKVFRQHTADEQQAAYQYLADISGIPIETLQAAKIVFETSRMDHTKRKDLLLRAFARAASETADAYLFIGGGPENDLFKTLTAERDARPELRGRAFLTGFIPEEHIGPLFSIADVFASASEMEGFGMSVSQAAAAGAAVVSSDLVPFAVQYVPNDALIVPAGDEDGFAGAILRLLEDDEDRVRRAARLAEKVQALDWTIQTSAFIEFLREQGIVSAEERTQA